jgi:RNA polymerase sigma factor, sigma-70 family
MIIFPIAVLAIEDDSDRAYIEELYVQHERLMFYAAYKVLINKADAADAVNAACVAMIRNISTLKRLDGCTLRSYIVSCVRSASIDTNRKLGRESGYIFLAADDEIFAVPDEETVENGLLFAERIATLHCEIKKLSTNESNILRWKYFDEMSDAQIAELLDIKTVSVRTCLTRARRHLLERLEGKMEKHD